MENKKENAMEQNGLQNTSMKYEKVYVYKLNNIPDLQNRFGIQVVQDGVKSKTRLLSVEDAEEFFNAVKGKHGEEVDSIRNMIADRYFSPQAEQKRKELNEKEGVRIFQLKAEYGGGWGINVVTNGTRSQTFRLTEKDATIYSNALKTDNQQKLEEIRAEMGRKYFSPEALKIREDKKARMELEVKPLPELKKETAQRIHNAKIFRLTDGKYAVKAEIDGNEQKTRLIKNETVASFFAAIKGKNSEEKEVIYSTIAAMVYADVIKYGKNQQQTVSNDNGMKY